MSLKIAVNNSAKWLTHRLYSNKRVFDVTTKRFLSLSNVFQKKRLSYHNTEWNGLKLVGETVGDRIAIMANEKPNQVCYKFVLTDETFTFAQIKQRVDELAQSLLKLGFKRGDRLAIMLPNIPEMNISMFAAASIGCIAVLMNPAYKYVEVEYMLKKTKAKGIIVLDDYRHLSHYNLLKTMCPELENTKEGALIESTNLPDLKYVIMVKSKLAPHDPKLYKGVRSYESIQKHDTANQVLPYVDIDDPFVILFTSGTTGLPKGAVLSHHSLVNSSMLEHIAPGCPESNLISCVPIPSFHVFGLVVGTLSPIGNGSKLVVYPNFYPEPVSIMKSIHNDKCTSLKGPPVIFFDIMNHPDRKKYDLSSLELYGMSETTAAGTATTVRDTINKKFAYESISKPGPFMEIKITDPITGKILPINTDGEINIRGPSIMIEYWDEPTKTAETIDRLGWLKTGDMAHMDENGYVYYQTRIKELIKRAGINIYPAEVENFLRTHPDVLDVNIIGVPDERVGEEVCAWIRLKPTSVNVTDEQIKEFCNDKIAKFKVPRYIKFVDSFPVNATGKVQKFVMLEQMKKELNI